jgi:hypothetical protein
MKYPIIRTNHIAPASRLAQKLETHGPAGHAGVHHCKGMNLPTASFAEWLARQDLYTCRDQRAPAGMPEWEIDERAMRRCLALIDSELFVLWNLSDADHSGTISVLREIRMRIVATHPNCDIASRFAA